VLFSKSQRVKQEVLGRNNRLLSVHNKLRVGLGEDLIENTAFHSFVVACESVAAGTYLPIRCLATAACMAPLFRLSDVMSHCSLLKAVQFERLVELHDSQRHEAVKYGHESRGTRNQESLCWRGPAAVYQTDIEAVMLVLPMGVGGL
jgi:hypothetical protein